MCDPGPASNPGGTSDLSSELCGGIVGYADDRNIPVIDARVVEISGYNYIRGEVVTTNGKVTAKLEDVYKKGFALDITCEPVE